MSIPAISVVMPVYNTGVYLIEAVRSVLAQNGLPDGSFELVVVDDASTDKETLDILRALRGSDERIRLLANYRKKGVSGARNTGILESKGEWIAFLDSDDYFLPYALATHWNFITSNRNTDWTTGLFYLLRDGIIQRSPLSARSPNLYSLISDDFNNQRPALLRNPVEALAKNCFLAPPATMIRKSLLLEKGMFDESLRRAEDYLLWFRLARDTNLWVLPEEVYVHRFREGSLTTGHEPMYFHEHQMIAMLVDDPNFALYRSSLGKRFDFVMNDYCYFFRSDRSFGAAIYWAKEWLRRRPFHFSAWKQLVAALLRMS